MDNASSEEARSEPMRLTDILTTGVGGTLGAGAAGYWFVGVEAVLYAPMIGVLTMMTVMAFDMVYPGLVSGD